MGDESIESIFDPGYWRPTKLIASYFGFFMSQVAMFACYRRGLNGFYGLIGTVVVIQAVDSVVFFPAAYAFIPGTYVFELMAVGFSLKVGVGCLYAPIIYQAARDESYSP